MGKVTFSYDTFEEKDEIQIIMNATTFYSALNEIENLCRNKLKDESISNDEEELLEHIRQICGIIHSGKKWDE